MVFAPVVPATKHQYGQLVFDAFTNRKPMQFVRGVFSLE